LLDRQRIRPGDEVRLHLRISGGAISPDTCAIGNATECTTAARLSVIRTRDLTIRDNGPPDEKLGTFLGLLCWFRF